MLAVEVFEVPTCGKEAVVAVDDIGGRGYSPIDKVVVEPLGLIEPLHVSSSDGDLCMATGERSTCHLGSTNSLDRIQTSREGI